MGPLTICISIAFFGMVLELVDGLHGIMSGWILEILGLGNLVVEIMASLIIIKVHVGKIPVTRGTGSLLLTFILACGFWILVVLWKQVGVARGTTVGINIAIGGFIAITRLWLLIVIIVTAIDIRIGI
jgi:hypothetical protein